MTDFNEELMVTDGFGPVRRAALAKSKDEINVRGQVELMAA